MMFGGKETQASQYLEHYSPMRTAGSEKALTRSELLGPSAREAKNEPEEREYTRHHTTHQQGQLQAMIQRKLACLKGSQDKTS